MKKNNFDLIIPIYNEGQSIINLVKKIQKKIKFNFNIIFCYDSKKDNIFNYKKELKKIKKAVFFVKNPSKGPCTAVKAGLYYTKNKCKIVYPADDFINIHLIEKMYKIFKKDKPDIIVASRFIKGGSMIGCPLIKSILVRLASKSLYILSSIPVRDASNGFRMFSNRLLKKVKIESKVGFAYSLELLVKCERLKLKIKEIPAKWEERSIGQSRFKILKWLPQYLKWYFYGLATFWLGK